MNFAVKELELQQVHPSIYALGLENKDMYGACMDLDTLLSKISDQRHMGAHAHLKWSTHVDKTTRRMG